MFGSLIRAVVILVVLVGGGAFLLGWWGNSRIGGPDTREAPVGTTGVNADRARQVGAEVGEKTAVAANEARRAIANAQVTAKIKAKMALDESVKALNVNVDTTGRTVTLTGVVDSPAQRERVVRLARETDGVGEVVDHLRLRQ